MIFTNDKVNEAYGSFLKAAKGDSKKVESIMASVTIEAKSKGWKKVSANYILERIADD